MSEDDMMEPVRPIVEEGGCAQNLADRWFQTLDHRQIDVGTRRWTARVMGIHLDGQEAWIQIAAGRAQDKNLVLHLSGWTTIDQVDAAMKMRSFDDTSYPQVISVLPTV
jgi:hypothetical protein